MSKKSKKLEKENEALKRKHELMNQNIFKMAEDRTKNLKEVEDLKRKSDKLTSIITQMQQQGRGIAPAGLAAGGGEQSLPEAEAGEEGTEGGEGEESEYDEEEYEEISDEGEEGEYEDEDLTEEEAHPDQPQKYGPERPPPAPAVSANGC